MVVPRLEVLLHVNGTQQAPVKAITLRGLTFGHTVPTYTKRYTIPGPVRTATSTSCV